MEKVSCAQGGLALCQLSEGKFTNLQIQKILYFANMLHIGNMGQPLNQEQIFSLEIWTCRQRAL